MDKKIVKRKIILISTFAHDSIRYASENKATVREGGPAFWISGIIPKTRQNFQIVTGNTKARVSIIVSKTSERGKILSVSSIPFPNPRKADLFIISTIANEFKLTNIGKLHGMIAMDIQGYVRSCKNRRLRIPTAIAPRIAILKGTRKEIDRLNDRFIEAQKNRILLITKGNSGFEMFSQGQHYKFSGNPIIVKDTIGAGDVFFGAFCYKYLEQGDVEEAAFYAHLRVEKFLRKNEEHI